MSDAFQFGLKAAEIMLPGAQPSSGMDLSRLSASPTLPPITGPLTDELSPAATADAAYKSYAPKPIQLTDADIAAGRAQLDSERRNFYNPLKNPAAINNSLDWLANTKPMVAAGEWAANYGDRLYDAFNRSGRDAKYREPADQWARALLSPARLAYQGGKALNSAADNATDLGNGGWKDWEIWKPVINTKSKIDNIVNGVDAAINPKQTDPAALAAAKAAPTPTMSGYLSDSFKQNPLLWGLPLAGLGGLGAYGLYKALAARREAAKRRRLMSPAAIIN